jgi:inosine triphosphate pyrophosphatase
LKDLGHEGLYNLVNKLGDSNATARTTLAYAKSPLEVVFFEGELRGNIVKPRGKSGFGWDPVFQPKGSKKTFAELSQEEKNKISHRSIAVSKLVEYLKAHG